jgi:hypothetical protein
VLLFLRQLFNREFVEAVLQEWCKTMSNLPAGLRQACEMVKFDHPFHISYFSFGTIVEQHEFTRYISLVAGFGEFCTDGTLLVNICKTYKH